MANKSDITEFNKNFYDNNWSNLSDFSKYNPGNRHRKRIILKLLSALEFNSLLDVGCGNGEMLSFLQKKLRGQVAYSGVDLSEIVIEANRQSQPDKKFKALNICEEHLEDKHDVIVCSEVIEHIERREEAILNLSKMLTKEGYLLLTCPYGKVFQTEKYFGHISHPTYAEIESLAKNNDLKLISSINWGWPFYNFTKIMTNLNPEWSLNTFATKNYSLPVRMINHSLYFINYCNISVVDKGYQSFYLLQKT